MRRLKSRGFSLIELLIVVAIIAALVGVAVPFFQDNLKDAQQTKAKEDLDTVRNAISLHDAQNRALTGTSLRPLLGRYLQEIPEDPWGNSYMLDCGIGIIMSYGADGVSGGKGTDEDIPTRYKAPIRIQRGQYKGSWGKPDTGAEVLVTLSKPYEWDTLGETEFRGSLCLLRASRDPNQTDSCPIRFDSVGNAASSTPALDTWDAYATNWVRQAWTTVNDTDAVRKEGYVSLQQGTSLLAARTQIFTATMALNFDFAAAAGTVTYGGVSASRPSRFGVTERYHSGGPLNPDVYGDYSANYFVPPEPIDLVDNENRGVKLEKF